MTNELVMKVNVHELDRSAMFYDVVTGGESLNVTSVNKSAWLTGF